MGNISVYDKIVVKPENETDGIKIILHAFPSKDGVRVKFKAC